MRNLAEELALVAQMPMTFGALVIEYTTRCNARCGMCYQAAGPKGSDLLGRASLDGETMERAIRDAIEMETISPRLHVTGGEGFLDVDLLLRMMSVGRDAGFSERTTTTNAFWARERKRALALCMRARMSGMTGMEISWDFWHQPFIAPDAVSNCLEACFEVGIESHLRLLSSRSHSYEAALGQLRPASLACATRVSCAPILPTGRAATDIDLAEAYRQGSLDDACHGTLNLTINARGDVTPCCAGLDQTASNLFGNVRRTRLREIVRALNQSLLARILVFRGPAVLAAMLRDAGFSLGDQYKGICHLCWSIFSDPERVRALEGAMQRRRLAALERAIAILRSPAETSYVG